MVLGFLRGDVQRNFCEIQVCSDADSRGYVQLIGDLIHNKLCEFFWRHSVCVQITRNVDERFVDRVHMNVGTFEVFEIQTVDIGGIFNI